MLAARSVCDNAAAKLLLCGCDVAIDEIGGDKEDEDNKVRVEELPCLDRGMSKSDEIAKEGSNPSPSVSLSSRFFVGSR